jgi:hypothetical protein
MPDVDEQVILEAVAAIDAAASVVTTLNGNNDRR